MGLWSRPLGTGCDTHTSSVENKKAKDLQRLFNWPPFSEIVTKFIDETTGETQAQLAALSLLFFFPLLGQLSVDYPESSSGCLSLYTPEHVDLTHSIPIHTPQNICWFKFTCRQSICYGDRGKRDFGVAAQSGLQLPVFCLKEATKHQRKQVPSWKVQRAAINAAIALEVLLSLGSKRGKMHSRPLRSGMVSRFHGFASYK